MIKKIKELKRKISLKSNDNSRFFDFMVLINNIIFHWDERRQTRHYGNEDKDKVYYIIRPRGKDEGLLSTYYYVVANVCWANEKGYIPYVDFNSENCQYHVEYQVGGTNNAWEYYFTQPSSLQSYLSKKNVILSGWTFRKKSEVPGIVRTLKSVQNDKMKYISKNLCKINDLVERKAQLIYDNKFRGKKTLAVFLRGTDYVALKPKGHYVQPTVEEAIIKINEFLYKYEIDQIYVVTEDIDIFSRLKKVYGDKIFSIDDDFVTNYNKDNYISVNMKSDPYIRGLNYLIRVMLVTRCEYLVSGITNGSLFALNVKEDNYEDSYWFDLGLY